MIGPDRAVDEFRIEKEIRVTGTGSIVQNVLQLFGSVRITNQFAIIKEITTLSNATAVYATLFDGTVTKDLTKTGAVLSGAPVGTLFMKDKEITESFSVSPASECQVNEVLVGNKVGKPFTVTQKNGVDTFIQFRLTTTDAPIDFKMLVTFCYMCLNGGSCLRFL